MGSKFYGKNRANKKSSTEKTGLPNVEGVHRAVNVFKDSSGKKPVYMKTTIVYDPITQESIVESIEPIADSYTTAMKKIVDEISLKLLKNKEQIKKQTEKE